LPLQSAEAVVQLRKGLGLLSQLPEGAPSGQYELDLQVAFGRALMATRGFAAPEVGETCTRARQLCDQLNHPQFVPVLYGEWVHHFLRAELERARDGAEEILLLSEERNDAPLKAVGLRAVGMVSSCFGDFTGCRDNLERAVALCDPAHLAQYASLSPSNPFVVMRLWLSRTLGCLGYLDQAHTEKEKALAEARRLGHAFTLTHALVEICTAEWGLCLPAALLARADELLSLAVEQFTMFEPQGMMYRGWCLTALGQEDGTTLIKRGLAAFRATGSSLWVPFFCMLLADAYGKVGTPLEGLACLDDALRLVEVTHERSTEAEIHRVRGELFLLLQDVSAATAPFRTGIEIARRQQAKLFELRSSVSLANLWRDQGKRQQAHDLLAPVYAWFTEGFDTLDLKHARALLDELAS
jgi:predicted ATPase